MNDFELKAVIGKGYFGEVRVAKEKVTGDIFAMKIINKMKTLKNASVSSLHPTEHAKFAFYPQG